MCLDLVFQGLDLDVEGGQDRDLGADRGCVRGCDGRRLAEMFGAQCGGDLSGPGVAVAPSGALERRRDLAAAQLRRRGRVGCGVEQFQGVGGGQVVEGDQRSREEIPQCMAQPQQVASAFPDECLVCSGENFDRLRVGAVAGDRAKLVAGGAPPCQPAHARRRNRAPLARPCSRMLVCSIAGKTFAG
jgi:hypothetical protein